MNNGAPYGVKQKVIGVGEFARYSNRSYSVRFLEEARYRDDKKSAARVHGRPLKARAMNIGQEICRELVERFGATVARA